MRKLLLSLILIGLVGRVWAAQLTGVYTINALQPASSTNFQNFASAITFLTSSNTRSDSGPSNSAPFGVSGPVIFNVVANSGPYNEQVVFPNVTGASATNTITVNGNGNTIQFAPAAATDMAIVRFTNGDYYQLKNLIIKTTSTSFGWGIHFYTGSDYNVIDSCTIDIGAVTSTTAANSAGIVFSNNLSTPTTSGVNGYYNTISNCNLLGSTASYGMHYGIVGTPSTSGTIASGNRFINNVIQDFYSYGVYWNFGNGTIFEGNTIKRTASKSLVTTTYAFYLGTSAGRGDTLRNNVVKDLFIGVPTSTSTCYGVYGINYTGTTAIPNVIDNNLFDFNSGVGSQFGLYFLTAFNFKMRNNTVVFRNSTVTNTAYTTYGFYSSSSSSAASTYELVNNVFANYRTSVAPSYSIFVNGTFNTGVTLAKNSFYGVSPNYKLANIGGSDYSTLASYRALMGVIDNTSSDYDPNFVNANNGNFSPQEGWFNANGVAMPHITRDVTGAVRTLPIDIGAYEASPISLDVAASEVIMPATPYVAGTKSVSAVIRNAGASTITSAVLNWTINGVAQTPVNFSGTLTSGSLSSPIVLGNVNVQNAQLYTVAFTVSSPNGGVDAFLTNNSASGLTAAQLPGGTYTINASGAGASNFTSFSNFANVINTGGIAGALTINVAPNSGPYTEQVLFNSIQGSSASNNIVINGNGERIEFNNTISTSIGIFTLNGADYFTINNLGVRSLNTTNGVGYLLTNGADSNVIQNCNINISSVTSGSLSAGIAITASMGNAIATGANVGRFNRFEGNTISGNSAGGPYYGISLCVNNVIGAVNNGIVVKNNIIRDFTVYGIYMVGTMGSSIKDNVISRPTKASPTTFYGISGTSYMGQDTIENNTITQPFESAQTLTGTSYGMYFSSTNVPTARPVIIKNNVISNFKSNGAVYGLYFTTATSFRVYHNTIVVDHPTSTSTGATQLLYSTGTPNTLVVRNNIFYMNRGGTGNKHILYLNTTSATGYVFNNNVLHHKIPAGSTNNYLGYYSATNVNDLSAWKLVNSSAFDQNSVLADPLFRTTYLMAPNTPGSDSINNIGANLLADVGLDLLGNARTTTPDPGAYEFTVTSNDAGLTRFTSPLNPINLGTVNVEAIMKNFGTGGLTSAQIDWSVNGAAQNPYYWGGYVAPSDSSTLTIGSYNFNTSGFYQIKAWTSNPNGSLDSIRYNDTITTTVCTPLSGNFTINASLPASSTNFINFSSLVNNLSTCGVTGNVIVNVAAGTYNEQVSLTTIPGLSNGNRLYFIGDDSATTKLTFTPTNTNLRYTLLLQGVDNITFKNMKIENTGASFATAVQIFGDASNRSDSIEFIKCTFTVPYVASTAINTFVSSSSLTSATTTTFQNATAILIDSCIANGGYYGVCFVANTASRSTGIVIRNSKLTNSYLYGAYLNGVEYINCSYNQVLSIGRPFNYTTPYGIYIANSGVNLVVNANTINNLLGGYGIYVTTTIGSPFQRNVISNNMIQIGELTNTTYGIYLTSVGQFAVAHNAVNVTSGSATASCIYLSSTNGATYNTVDVINNISSNQNQGYVIYLNDGGASVTSNILQPVNWKIDNNCYYGLATYPYRSNNFISGTLQNYQTATAIGLDSFSLVMNPVFVSPTNLRTTALPLNNVGRANTWVTTDIDGQLRGAMPDIGVNEFNPPLNDAGVVGFVLPKAPQDTGYTDVRVLIRNFGAGAITSTDVTYTDGVTTHTTTYTGNLPSNGLDTVTFNQTSGAGATNQQYHYMGNSLVFKAYTSNPNVSTDAEPLNDTLTLNVCRALSGVYTINPVGSGLTNFTSFTAAIAALNCGGVLGPVEFNVASGTYTEQIDLGIIPGASAANWIKFKSATQNRNDVILTFAPTTANTNYTVAYSGTNYVYFEYLTIRNTSATFGRVLSFGISGSRYASNNGIRECNIVGAVVTTTADANSLIFAAGGTHVQNIAISKCSLQNGSSAINFGGQNVINQYSDGLVIDSNTITGTYYYGIMLASRSNTKIRNNNILMGTAANYGIYITSGSNAMEISRNTVNTPLGYALYISTFNYYGELFPGRVFNNSFVVSSSATSGIYCTNVSNIRIYNNSVNIQSTSTTLTQGGLYISGSSGAAPVVNASQIYVYNNAIFSATLPALSLGNAAAISALVFNDHNVYSNTGTVLVYINGSSIASANFATVKGAINGLNDQNSYYTPAIGFTSNVNLTPLATNSSSWVLNGRGYHDFGLNSDIAGNFRSEAVSTGAPDIGAYEFTPVAAPPVSTVVGTIGYGNTQYFISFGDTIGSLTWGYSGTLPTSVNMAFYPGTLISNRATSPNNNVNIDTAAHLMDAYWRVSQNGGSNFYYDVRLRYKPFQLGTVPSETDLRFADRQVNTYHSWWRNNNFSTILDTVNNIIGMNFISDTSTYTGTTDISSPLPVKINALRATKFGMDGVISWSTASERNSSIFIIERSFNRSNFTAIGKVTAAGNSSVMRNYEYADLQVGKAVKNQTVYYRLKMVDLDGRYEYSPVVSVSFNEQATTKINVFPNPFQSEVSINITSETNSNALVNIVDIMGKQVASFTQQVSEGDNLFATPLLNNLNNGVYFIKVTIDGKEAVSKLIKQ